MEKIKSHIPHGDKNKVSAQIIKVKGKDGKPMKSSEAYKCPADTIAKFSAKTFFAKHGSSYEWNVWFNGMTLSNSANLTSARDDLPVVWDSADYHEKPGHNFLCLDGKVETRRPARPPGGHELCSRYFVGVIPHFFLNCLLNKNRSEYPKASAIFDILALLERKWSFAASMRD